jgi:hypothetical protein
MPIAEYREELMQHADYILAGCWTKGLFVVFQKPDEIWSDFAHKLPVPEGAKVALFATYKIRTGSMFKNMAKHVIHSNNLSFPNLKSRNGKLSEKDKIVLDEFIN